MPQLTPARPRPPGQFEDFPTVTRRALQHALHQASQSLSDAQIGDMMTAYNALEPFPDVIRGLQLLEQHSATVHPVVFSNGSAEMLDAVLRGKAVAGKAAGKEEGQAGGLGQKVDVFRGYVSLAELRRYKPVREGYELLVKKVGRDPSKAGDRDRVWVVSSNEWDVLGAKTAGLQACWVDRAGRGYGAGLLGSETRPDFVGRDLEDAISKIVGSQVE